MSHAVYSQVVAADGTAYVTTADLGTVTAFDLATGVTRWSVNLDAPTHATCDGRDRHPGIWGAAAVQNGVVYVGAPDGAVHALDANTGAERWRAQVAQPSPDGELLASSVTVSAVLGKAYVGVASTATCDLVVGKVAAIDLTTGAVTTAALAPTGQRGAGVWGSASVDEAAGVIFIGTGNTTSTSSAVPLSISVVALDARTLAVRDHWQNPTTLTDADFGASPLLYEAGGRRFLAITSKDGYLYAFDRDQLSAGPLWTRQVAVIDPSKPTQGGDPLAGFGSISSPAFANGMLYVGGGRTPSGEAGAVWALDPATGAVRFVHFTPGAVLAPPAAVDQVLLVTSMTPGGGGYLEVVDALTGAGLEQFDDATLSLAAPSWASGQVLWGDQVGAVRRYAVGP